MGSASSRVLLALPPTCVSPDEPRTAPSLPLDPLLSFSATHAPGSPLLACPRSTVKSRAAQAPSAATVSRVLPDSFLQPSGFQFHLHAQAHHPLIPDCNGLPQGAALGTPGLFTHAGPHAPGTLDCWAPGLAPVTPTQASSAIPTPSQEVSGPFLLATPTGSQGLASEGASCPPPEGDALAWSLFVYSWVACRHSCGAAGSQ